MGENKKSRKLKYEKVLRRQKDPYEAWIGDHETVSGARKDGNADPVTPGLEEVSPVSYRVFTVDGWLCFAAGKGVLSDGFFNDVKDFFKDNPDCLIAYGDEDDLKDGKRCDPWFKPEWSPDKLRSFFYFGSIFFVKGDFLNDIDKNAAAMLRDKEAAKDTIAKDELWDEMIRWTEAIGEENRRRSIRPVQKVLYHNTEVKRETLRTNIGTEENDPSKETEDGREYLVSVIIPSKDHPELVKACLDSLTSGTEYDHYEVILVDNGSGTEACEKIADHISCKEEPFDGKDGIKKGCILTPEKKKVSVLWIRQKAEFNFSAMCNLGVKYARGEVYLFLNDDITLLKETGRRWMKIMAREAKKKSHGAVGALLLYPENNRIQHAGITNMCVGPVHKMGGEENEENIYHFSNAGISNVSAVTGACLMIGKEHFLSVGGFCEELAVAYNDVDLCFSLYEKGLYNVQRNDIVLCHHESVSRGTDESAEKKRRLMRERIHLYERHPHFAGKDPYYSPHLVQYRLDAGFHTGVTEEYEVFGNWSEKKNLKAFPRILEGKVVRKMNRILCDADTILCHVDRMEVVTGILPERSGIRIERGMEIEGWAATKKTPLYLFDRYLIVRWTDGRIMRFKMFDKCRPDTKAVLEEQKYYELSGFVVRIPEEIMGEAIREMAIEMKRKTRVLRTLVRVGE